MYEDKEEAQTSDKQHYKLSEEAIAALCALKETLYQETKEVRWKYIKEWRENEALWRGIQNAFFLAVARDVVTVADLRDADIPGFSELNEVDERYINIIRAHGESIIAALSTQIPYAVFSPEDADNPDDIATAKTFRKAADLIEIQQEAVLKIVKILYHLWLHGISFAYNVYHKDNKYGIIKRPQIGYKDIVSEIQICQGCGTPQEESTGLMGQTCPNCGGVEFETQQVPKQIPFITSVDETPKGRSLIEIFGPLHVTIPYMVKSLEHAGFLRLDTDIDQALVQEIYPDSDFATSSPNDEDKANRVSPGDAISTYNQLDTVTRMWFRTWMFNRIKDEEIVKELKTAFPDGAYCVFVNDTYVESCSENMDDVWTCTVSSTSEYLYADPLCRPLTPIQFMLNELVSLSMDTIESGISNNFVDPAVVDLKQLGTTRARPGQYTPIKAAKAGMALDNSFYSSKPATLSQEVGPFTQYLEQKGQFVVGSFPSVFGGNQETGSHTLGEYRESKETALQRLSLPHKSLASMWMHTIHKAVLLMVNNMVEDEHYVKSTGTHSFVNVWIRMEELKGKIGNVVVENSENLPVSYSMKRQLVLDMMNQKSEQLNAVLFHPENFGFMQKIFGFTDLYIPGDDDRTKQLREIQELLAGQPIPGPDGMMMPSVQPESFDNNDVCMETLAAWLKSDIAQEIRNTNPAAYQNVLAQYNVRKQQQMMEQQSQMAEEEQPANEEQPVQ